MAAQLSFFPPTKSFKFAELNPVSELSFPEQPSPPSTSSSPPFIFTPSTKMRRSRNNLTDAERQQVFEALLSQSVAGKKKKGSCTEVASQFHVSQRTVRRIWNQASNQVIEGGPVDVRSRIGRSGHKRVVINPEAVAAVPFRLRSSIRSLATALGVQKSSLHRRIKEGALIAHTNAIKPALTDSNRKQRLQFSLSMVNRSSSAFDPMFNRIHIDEKWFYLSKASKRYYLLPSESEPHRVCKSKKFITKVMFLAAVARPRLDPVSGQEVFSGKLGIWPFTELQPAQRSSKNRPAGTLQSRAISVTKEITRQWLITKVLPAIKEKWPADHFGPIWIQQDNAKPHLDVHDSEFNEAVGKLGMDIRLCCQPPNSPDLNVLDLGFFRAIQSLQETKVLSNIEDLIEAVQSSYQSMSSIELNKVWLTLQSCMKEILQIGGGNNYKTPHIGKGRLLRHGLLPLQIEVEQRLWEEVEQRLIEEQD